MDKAIRDIIIIFVLGWGIGAAALHAVLSFRLPNYEQLESFQLSEDERIEERGRKRSRVIHIYTQDDRHIVHPKHFGAYQDISSAVKNREELEIMIWSEENDGRYGIYEAFLGEREVLSFSEASELRSRNIQAAKYIAGIFFLMPLIPVGLALKK